MDTQVLEDQAVIISSKRTTRSSRNNSIVPTEDEDDRIVEEEEEEIEEREDEDEDLPSDRLQNSIVSTPAVQHTPKPVGRPPKSRNAVAGSTNAAGTVITGATRGRKPGARRGRKPKDHTATPVSEKLDPFKNLHHHINNHYKEHLAAQEVLKKTFASAPETLADINLLYDLSLDAELEWNQTVEKLKQVLVNMKDKWMMLEYKRRKLLGEIQVQKSAVEAAEAKTEIEVAADDIPVGETVEASVEHTEADQEDTRVIEASKKESDVSSTAEESVNKSEESIENKDIKENATENKDITTAEQGVEEQENEPALKKRKL